MDKHCKTVSKSLDQGFPPPTEEKEAARHPRACVLGFDSKDHTDPRGRTGFPLFAPGGKKKRNLMAKGWNENRPVPIDHREGGILSRSPRKACISILTLETRAPSKDWREGRLRGRVNQEG